MLFHDGMTARIVDIIGVSGQFPVQNGTKQGCVLVPSLFNLFYSGMLLDAFRNCNRGVDTQYRTEGGIFSLRRLNSTTTNARYSHSVMKVPLNPNQSINQLLNR